MSYDPTFAYELAVIVHDGLRRMFERQENVFYYITCMNENYPHPALPDGAEAGILQGMYRLRKAPRSRKKKPAVQLLGSGTILREVIAAAELLAEDFDVQSDVWSVTSFNELARQGRDAARYNMLHPEARRPRLSYVEQCLGEGHGPVVAATDYIRSYADQIRAFVPQRYEVLGTDGFGRSDTRAKLREFFEVNRYYVAVAALKALADDDVIAASVVADAIRKYDIDPEKPNPLTA